MKTRVAILLLALILLTPCAARAESFAEGVRALDEGRHLEARRIFSAIIERGETTANAFYNLGNANAQIGAPGLAALNYERALALDGQHSEARENLARLRARSGAVLPERTMRDTLLGWLSFDSWVLAFTASAWAGLFAFLIPFGRRVPMRAGNWVVATFAALISSVCTLGIWHTHGELDAAIVLAQEAEARQLPSEQAPLLPRGARLPAGSRVIALAERGEWVHCRMPNGEPGWLPADAIGKIRQPSWDHQPPSSESSS
jgi:tetratricopeptide (TPR) repeat protein